MVQSKPKLIHIKPPITMIVHLHGYLGQDAEVLKRSDDQEYVKLSVAEKTAKDKKPQWVTVFSNYLPPKLLLYLKKGSLVYVLGKLKVDVYEGKPQLIINSMEIQLLSNKKEESSEE